MSKILIESLNFVGENGKAVALSLPQALQIRTQRKVNFTCPSCGYPATVHSGKVPLHGEHIPQKIDGKRRLPIEAKNCLGTAG